MTDFGDFDPEDAYDAGDDIPDRLVVLRRVAEHLRDHPADGRRAARRTDALRLVVRLEEEPLDAGQLAELASVRSTLEAL